MVKKKTNDLAMFEDEPVESATVTFIGTPDMLIQNEHRKAQVAYLVIGSIAEVGFKDGGGEGVTRMQKAKMRRVLQIPHERGIELFAELDEERLKGMGISALPFPKGEPEPFPGDDELEDV